MLEPLKVTNRASDYLNSLARHVAAEHPSDVQCANFFSSGMDRLETEGGKHDLLGSVKEDINFWNKCRIQPDHHLVPMEHTKHGV